jgi:beta-lactamase class A
MKKLTVLICSFSFFLFHSANAQIDILKQKIEQITTTKDADVGIAIFDFKTGDTLSVNGNSHFPMQSVYKLHLALAIFNEIEKGKFSLNQNISINQSDLLPNTHSPLREKYPTGNVKIPLQDLLDYTVSLSDNNGCDILFRLVGGPVEVENYIHSIGVRDVAIKATEEEMGEDWDVQFTNWTTPLSAIELLKKIHGKEILSKENNDLLWKMLVETPRGKMRIKANLPEGTVVAHKAGTSGKDENGISAAVNDIGFEVLPDETQIAICVFISNSKEADETNEKVIADIAKATWDYFTNSNNGRQNIR